MWRHELARAADAHGDEGARMLYKFKADRYVMMQYRHLRRAKASKELDAANRLFKDNTPRCRAESMLLCSDMTLGDVAAEMAAGSATMDLFEKLFFNVRDDSGSLAYGRSARDFIALRGLPKLTDASNHESYWKITAIEGGRKALFALWGWKSEHTMSDADMAEHFSRSTFRAVDARLRANTMDAKALAQMLSDIGNRLGKLREAGLIGVSEPVSDESLALRMLSMVGFQPMCAISDESAKTAIDRMRTLGQSGQKAGSMDSVDTQLKGAQNVNVQI